MNILMRLLMAPFIIAAVAWIFMVPVGAIVVYLVIWPGVAVTAFGGLGLHLGQT